MKKFILALMTLVITIPAMAQEETSGGSQITDIMNIDAANEFNADYAETMEKYQEAYDKAKTRCDENLAKIDDSYRKDVQSVMEEFSKILEKGIRKDVENQKKSTATKVNSLTIQHRANKKRAVVELDNELSPQINQLPKKEIKKKKNELQEALDTYYAQFETDYVANQAAISAFKMKEHLLEAEATASSSEEE